MNRRSFALASAVLLAVLSCGAWAQPYPSKPIRIVVGFPPGGSVDIIARTIGNRLADSLRQQVVIDNKPGAAGSIAAEIAAKAPPDGYTLFMQDIPTHAINASLSKSLRFDSVKDFSSVILVASAPIVLVSNPAFPAKTLAQLVDMAKASPGKINFASGGTGASTHLAGELLKMTAGIDITHIAYKGAPLALADVMAGQVQLLFSSLPGALALIKSGKLQPIVLTSGSRSSSAPDIPSAAEAGFPGVEASQRFGLMAPAGTPAPIIGKLNAEILQVLRNPEVVQAIAKLGYDTIGGTPAELDNDLKSEMAKWAKVVRTANVRAE